MKTAYPQFHGTTKIRLYANIPFDNTYQHHSIISDLFKYNNVRISSGTSLNTQERFIDRKKTGTSNVYYYPRWDITGDYNFDYTNGLVGSVVLELTPAQTNANYLRVYAPDNNNGGDYYYYFITGITQINADTYRLNIECDVLMTYQDEFLTGMANVPVFTKRKHCTRYTSSTSYNFGKIPFCADLLGNEDIASGVKTNHIKSLINLTPKNVSTDFNYVTWLYVCVDLEKISDNADSAFYNMFRSHYGNYPLSMVALPINVNKFILKYNNSVVREVTYNRLTTIITKLVGDGSVHGAKISKYPPVEYKSNMVYNSNTNELTMILDTNTQIVANFFTATIGDATFTYSDLSSIPADSPFIYNLLYGGLLVSQEGSNKHQYTNLLVKDVVTTNTSSPVITDTRKEDIKLSFSPFTKYTLTAGYSSDGVELYPELVFASVPMNSINSQLFDFATYHSAYIGDNNMFTFPESITYTYNSVSYTPLSNYNLAKNGLASSINYIVPVGENALDVFNATQAQAFYQSKTASGITSGLSVGGGIASIALGAGAMAGSKTLGTGLIASGVTAIASGVASATNTILSANAKIQDLKNTPDSINISGSSYTTDMSITNNTALPFIIVSECSPVIKHNADDYFYNYGYQVARECYFNTEMKQSDAMLRIDNNLFGRTIFNYIQLNEDITNKINADIPHIIKQKLSKIFNEGITLWSFFGFDDLWNTSAPMDANYAIEKWFMKCDLDNTEYTIQQGL